ncbi:unnamed protein product [Urochloa decumbens]|uniref:Uncharacterized protein n=1 Tax=Urochloa decumbens TaxID=240449 RepID=A0ABC9FPC8_9POAL
MIRRFVNLVLADHDVRMHTLHRLDVAKHLFYPSTAAAEAANAKAANHNNGSGGGGDKPKKLPRIDKRRRRRLPEPSMRFSPFFPAAADECADEREPWPSADDAFLLLSPGTSEGRILHATEGGRAVLYDADAGSISAAVQSFPEPMGRHPIAFSVPGAGEFMDEKESLYVMRSTIKPPPEHNRYDGSSAEERQQDPAGDFVVLDFDQPYEWQPLPPPPFAVASAAAADSWSRSDGGGAIRITASAVIGGGRTICVSTASSYVGCNHSYSSHGVERTYCFDTAHVPELGVWIGLSSKPPHHLCAADLSATAMNANQAPKPQHVWDDFTPLPEESSSIVLNRRFPQYVLYRSKEWVATLADLVNLGSGRFCIVKVFDIRQDESVGRHVDDMLDDEEFAVLTGIEVVRGGEGGELRMVKHKSKWYELGANDWVL